MKKTEEILPPWARWILLLPGSIAAWAFIYGLIVFIVENVFLHHYKTDYEFDFQMPSRDKVAHIIGTFIGAIIYIQAAYALAPKSKKLWCLILLILFLLFGLGGAVGESKMIEHGYYFTAIRDGAGSLGCIVGYFLLPKKRITISLYEKL
jgi:hypothetical protein